MKQLRCLITVLVLLTGFAVAQSTVRIGLAEDPDILDPDLARTYVGRIVFASLCDKLFEITTDLEIVPQLATEHSISEDGLTLTLGIREGVVFHDGTPLDAEAVKYNLERSLNLPGSNRRSEIQQIDSVEVTGEFTVQVNLSEPFTPLIAQLSDRAGMMISPTAAEESGEGFGNNPVCSGPFSFVRRVAQDRIELARFADYWDAENVLIDRVVFLPIPDASVRLANLQSGDLDILERPAPTDLNTVRNDPNLELPSVPSLGYQGVTINLANPEPRDHPLSQDPRVREAFDLAIDRVALNQVVNDGEFIVGNQPVPPSSPWYIEDYPVLERDAARARELLSEAGHERVAVELMVANSPISVQTGEVIQAMVSEAGFDVSLRPTEFASALNLQEEGQYDAFQVGWSGRLDPDGNIHQYHTCEGSLNQSGYCDEEVDRLLNRARTVTAFEERHEAYRDAALIYLPARSIIYLFHQNLFFPHSNRLEGFQAYPDGLIRLKGVSVG
ncbi:MAG: ABC transporter substrate-binding protein [Deinococcota bacterium]|nr:ABC transporter substrate-binding protein [Deinococcota bacterium]